ncbi:MAG: hypothetical protein V1766_14810 [Pseudomonadota bacterium]
MAITWKSIGLYEHPAKHNKGVFGRIVLHDSGIYSLMVGGSNMSCPPAWAAKIHHDEGDEKESAIIIRNVPESLRKALKIKAMQEDKTMQGLILELITRYVGEKQGE